MAKTGGNKVQANGGVALGTSRTSKGGSGKDHIQKPGKPGYSSPNRTVKTTSPGVTDGYHVTSPDATPSSVMDLKKRP